MSIDPFYYFKLKGISTEQVRILSAANAGAVDISGLMLDGVDFRGVGGLKSVRIYNCGMNRVDFRGINIESVHISSSFVKDCFFDRASIKAVRVVSCQTQGVTFYYSNIGKMQIEGSVVWVGVNNANIENLRLYRSKFGMGGLVANSAKIKSLYMRHVDGGEWGRSAISLVDAVVEFMACYGCTSVTAIHNEKSKHPPAGGIKYDVHKKQVKIRPFVGPHQSGFIENTFYYNSNGSLSERDLTDCIYWHCNERVALDQYYFWFNVDTSMYYDCAKVTRALMDILGKKGSSIEKFIEKTGITGSFRECVMRDLFSHFDIDRTRVCDAEIERRYGVVDQSKFVDISNSLIIQLIDNYGDIFSITPDQLESLTCNLLEKSGYKVHRVGAVNKKDGGIDIVAWKKDVITYVIAVQVKHHKQASAKVGSPDVREFAGAVMQNRAFNAGMMVTSTDFTDDAKWISQKSESAIHLKSSEDLKQWMSGNFCDFQKKCFVIELAPGVSVSI